MTIKELKQQVYEANMALVKHNLVVLTWGNVSGIDRKKGLVVIKPSGVCYSKMKPSDMVVVSLKTGKVVEGKLKPSSDTPTHLELYRKFPNIGGVCHTHSNFATAWAQTGLDIPPLGTTHADTFNGWIPCVKKLSKQEVEHDYELNTGKAITRRFGHMEIDYEAIPGCLVQSHGVFTWGECACCAVKHAVILEAVAKLAYCTLQIKKPTAPIDNYLLKKHYNRKHGKCAYYGQKKK